MSVLSTLSFFNSFDRSNRIGIKLRNAEFEHLPQHAIAFRVAVDVAMDRRLLPRLQIQCVDLRHVTTKPQDFAPVASFEHLVDLFVPLGVSLRAASSAASNAMRSVSSRSSSRLIAGCSQKIVIGRRRLFGLARA